MNEVKAVFFDFDGLLVNTDELIFNATKSYLSDNFSINLTKSDFCEFFGLSGKDFTEAIVRKYALTVNAEEVLAEIISLIDYDSIKLKPYAKQLLDYLKGKYKTYLVTNSSKESFELKIKNIHDIIGLFDKVVTVDNVKPKPDPEIYIKALVTSSYLSNQCLVLEDSEFGVIAAVKSGCETILIPNEFVANATDISQKYNIKACNSLSEVTNFLEAKND